MRNPRWLAAVVALGLAAHVNAQQPPPASQAADAQRFTDVTTKLIAAINADDQAAIQQMFSEGMQTFLPLEKSGPFFRGVLSAKGKLRAAGAPEVSGPAAKVRVTAERGDWQFEITLDGSDKIAGLRVLPGDDKPERREEAPAAAEQAAKEKTYFDLRRSNDRVTRMTADRYFNLVKQQEWIDATGKSRVSAKYVGHDPNLQWVKLQVVRGRGAQREVKEVTVPVAKLNRTCQSRVKQIDAMQKRLDQLLVADTEADAAGEFAAGAAVGDPGAPMLDEQGVEPELYGERGERLDLPPQVDPRSPPSTGDPNASSAEFEPDPLGFAEVPLPPPQAGGGEGPSIPGMPLLPGGAPVPAVDRTQWPTSYEAFLANFTVVPDETGQQKVDWGELDELRAIGEGLTGEQAVGPSGELRTASPERLPNVQWEATFQGFMPSERNLRMAFDLPPLPPPLEIQFRLDDKRLSPDAWNQIAADAGNRVAFTGRLTVAGPTSIVVFVRDPKPATIPAAPR